MSKTTNNKSKKETLLLGLDFMFKSYFRRIWEYNTTKVYDSMSIWATTSILTAVLSNISNFTSSKPQSWRQYYLNISNFTSSKPLLQRPLIFRFLQSVRALPPLAVLSPLPVSVLLVCFSWFLVSSSFLWAESAHPDLALRAEGPPDWGQNHRKFPNPP